MGKKDLEKIVGAAYEDLNTEDMQNTQGAGDTEAETVSLAITGAIASVISGAISLKKCV
ncbi:lichenicidin A2 family type 2 lantibiotic [Butyrivibrio sp. INlla21]|uniref:lichenicidin A2 family type 2 lantibiotic n=1 Tax=Butyrivibrio sp. INlla21 TaxID=1520811 RepID=UPI0008F0731E|nr:lichenicidin A2 family type 2 lantibiotic [Butyrivibrio sp. INlla21]SFU96282.1 type 2 lantibiotic, SP_1948 family [Butyrivibrio sp. INlla21]